jgi:hypothetical protein
MVFAIENWQVLLAKCPSFKSWIASLESGDHNDNDNNNNNNNKTNNNL